MSSGFLGSGLKFPFQINKQGGLKLSQREDKIRESIMIILGTAKGERVMLPDFGCDIHEYVFSVINTATTTSIESEVEDALLLWEPRIKVLNVECLTEYTEDGVLSISIDYNVRSTNTEFNLVYPFFLTPGGG